jgi:hypothetical protein
MPQFEAPIRAGIKDQTIRGKRKFPYKIGEVVSLRVWTGRPYMSPQREFAQAEIELVIDFGLKPDDNNGLFSWFVGGEKLRYASEIHALAVRDGFTTAASMTEFFLTAHRLPFDGDIYRWRLL